MKITHADLAGKITVTDDGMPDPTPAPTIADVMAAVVTVAQRAGMTKIEAEALTKTAVAKP